MANENVTHIFANCSFARDCWRVLDDAWQLSYVDSLANWLDKMMDVLSVHMLEKVVMVCWGLWENKNAMLWSNQCRDSTTLVQHVLFYAQTWQNLNATVNDTSASHMQRDSCWQPPPTGYYNMNIDVSMDINRRCMGFGWVIRDDYGKIVGVLMSRVSGLYSIKEAEAMGAREALSWINKKGWTRVILETDAQVVTQAVNNGDFLTLFGAIVYEIRVFLSELPYVHFPFVRRSSNMLAHVIAKRALCNVEGERVEYLDFLPRFLSLFGLI
ncbi:uncharacterized protein LOC115999334 [Ipomoea triloba]|uniref:uncharacterized protein LOC115999334 n=1 Tax=Ipomoea triloba TaxID=35885 RepID=UPI00125D8664|nr:uncharacterized protein LOC115999334 [Ipomoea triloba]